MHPTALRKWVLISVAFIAASSLVLVAASRLGDNAQADTVTSTAPALSGDYTTSQDQAIQTGSDVSRTIENRSSGDSNDDRVRHSSDDDDEDEEHEAEEHRGRSSSSH